MRTSFFNTVEKLSQKNKNIMVLTADLGFKLFDSIKENCSDRFYDIGVAEANMIGISAGLSLSGKNVYCYSIVPFLVMRAYEQIRVDVDYHKLNVKLVGVGGGVTYGFEGFTHFGLEDFALMRSLHNMTIVVPADPFEAECLAEASVEFPGPMYIRLGRAGEPMIHGKKPKFEIGKAIVMKEGKDIALIATGNMVYTGAKVVDLLKKEGISSTLINIHTIKPLDIDMINQIASAHKAIFSLEEHNLSGGLGSAIVEVLSEKGYTGIFKRFGIDCFEMCVGNADFLRHKYGLTVDKLSREILQKLRGL
jgi:transketolase